MRLRTSTCFVLVIACGCGTKATPAVSVGSGAEVDAGSRAHSAGSGFVSTAAAAFDGGSTPSYVATKVDSGLWVKPAGGQPAQPPAQPPDDADSGTPTNALLTGETKLIEVFPTAAGIVVVWSNEVRLIDRKGSTLKSWQAPREITSAAFDGSVLGIADMAKLTALDTSLTTLSSVTLVETCVASVIVSGKRFVCGPSNDWDRIFYTYDLTSAKLLATSDPYTYHGIPMRRVPGTDDFVTVTTALSPSDFHLYRVGVDDKVSYINESPYHGDFPVDMTFAFDGTPPDHLITGQGLMLAIYGASCSPNTSSLSSGCFVKDGAIGTLLSGQAFQALADDGAGAAYGLVDPDTSGYTYEAACTGGCLLQHIDVANRTIVSQVTVQLSLGMVIAAHFDPVGQALVIGYTTTSRYAVSSAPMQYAISQLPVQ